METDETNKTDIEIAEKIISSLIWSKRSILLFDALFAGVVVLRCLFTIHLREVLFAIAVIAISAVLLVKLLNSLTELSKQMIERQEKEVLQLLRLNKK